MPPNNGSNGSAHQANGRKRPSQGRVVPAIPLALSKPKPSKARPKSETETRAGVTPSTPQIDAANSVESQDAQATTTTALTGKAEQVIAGTPIDETNEPPPNAIAAAAVDTPVSRDSDAMSISNGATPEPAVNDSQQLATPPAAVPPNQQALVSPSSGRRPTDKFDMRPLRTELPPAFIPSAERNTPQSAGSLARRNTQSQFANRIHHPSTSSIIFGGHDSSSSSPALPQSADSDLQSAQWPPLGSQRPPRQAPSGHGHGHHVSEPFMQRSHQPSHLPPGMPWNMRQGPPPYMHNLPPFQQHGPSTFRYPPREVFTPAEERLPNGFHSRSRSGSHASSAAIKPREELRSPVLPDTASEALRAPFMPAPPQLRHHHQPQHAAPPQQMPHPEMAARFENAEGLRHHVQSQYANPMLADCHLQINEDHEGGRQYLDSHKIILARSSTMLDLIQSSDPPISATLKTQVQVRLRGRYVRLRAFTDCVQYLYGGTLSMLNQHRYPHGTAEAFAANEERMESALQLVATAAWLKLPAIVARGMDVALILLHWNTLSSVLAFALDGGLGPTWTVEDGSDVSCASSDDSLGRLDGTGVPTYDPYSTDLLHRVIDFTVHMFPPNFYLDASAPQLTSCPRLPPLPPSHESRPSRADPRLSQIRFGEVPVEDHNRPSLVTTTISSMLLSLPFALLKCILEHNDLVFQLGADTVASIMRQVVAEREVRRKRVLQARPAGPTADGIDLQLVQNMHFEEEVELSPHHRSGFRLARRRRGIDTPPSSGPVSEK